MGDATKSLYEEVLRRFPEVNAFISIGDDELPSLVLGYIVEWLLTVATPSLDHETIERVVEFHRWCRDQPRGKTAADDIHTIEYVGLFEELFNYDQLLPLISHLVSKEELLLSKEYLVTWVGLDRYEAALELARDDEQPC